jgi:uncharacterized alkaline shock family protein YloU
MSTGPSTTAGTAELPAEGAEDTAGGELTRPAPADAAVRGRLDVSPRAVERIVAAAAGEVHGVGGSVHRVLGQALGSADPDSRPRAKVTVAGELVTAEVSMSVAWPEPVPEVAGRVRDRVALRLDRLAGLRLGYVDVTVTALPRHGYRRRVE